MIVLDAPDNLSTSLSASTLIVLLVLIRVCPRREDLEGTALFGNRPIVLGPSVPQ